VSSNARDPGITPATLPDLEITYRRLAEARDIAGASDRLSAMRWLPRPLASTRAYFADSPIERFCKRRERPRLRQKVQTDGRALVERLHRDVHACD
jgi:hypothetical protein